MKKSLFCLFSALLLLSLPANHAIAGSAIWLASPGTGDWNTATNWTGATVPNAATDTATFGVSSATGISLSATTQVNGVTFSSGANAFALTVAPTITLTINGTGITNNSGNMQTFVTAGAFLGFSGQIYFINNATAGINTAFTNNGLAGSFGPGGQGSSRGGSTQFFDTATAASGTFTNNGGTGFYAYSGYTRFYNTATAGNGVFTNNGGTVNGASGGQTYFGDTTTAGSGTFTNNAATGIGAIGGSTYFGSAATAGSGTFTNNAGTVVGTSGSFTWFADTSTAGNGTFTNNGATVSGLGGSTRFLNTATAGNGTFINNGAAFGGPGGGTTSFGDTTTAANATFTNNGATVSGADGGATSFNNTATAGNATFSNNGGAVSGANGGQTYFGTTGTAGNGTFTNNAGTVNNAGGGATYFRNSATAGNGFFTNNNGTVSGSLGGVTAFYETATAGSGTFTNNSGPISSGALGGVLFHANTTADHGTFINNGATTFLGFSGYVAFLDSSTAGNGSFTNNGGTANIASGGRTQFQDHAIAGNGTFTNDGGTANGALGGNTLFANNTLTVGSSTYTTNSGTFVNNAGTVSGAYGGYTLFDTADAGTGVFTNNGGMVAGAEGGSAQFQGRATAGSGTFTNNGASIGNIPSVSTIFSGNTRFKDSATAGSGTFIANGGTGGGDGGSIRFGNDSTGGTAIVKLYGNGYLDISSHNAPGVTIGSVEGTGNVFLGARNLTVGSNNLSTLPSGSIQDGGTNGGTGGSFTKIGTGTLTLSSANTYTGGTTISAGTVLATNAGGSAFGTGPVTVANGATLGGNGTIGAPATAASGGHLAPGNSTGTLTFSNGLTLANGAILDFQLGTNSSRISVTGGTLTGPAGTHGITLNLSNAGGFASGVTYPLFNFVNGQTSSFDVTDFTLGTLIGTSVASDYSFNLTATSLTLTYNAGTSAPLPPVITSQPVTQTLVSGASTTLSVGTSAVAPVSYQWLVNGQSLTGATSANLALANVQPANTGIYAALVTDSAGTTTSDYAILGVFSTSKVIGVGSEIAHGIFVASNGYTFDQVLPSGAAVTVTAEPGKITRTSFVDLTNDIVQVEFSGAGTLSLVLDNPSGPATAVNYNQPTVSYMKGHAGIVITGADDTTNVSVFSVGTLTAVNQALFKTGVTYDGMADLAFIAIASTNGKFGGVRTANGSYYAAKGLTGLYAPGVQFTGPVYVGDINASAAATPVLLLGSVSDARITGGDLLQANGQPVKVSGITQLKFTAGSTSHGVADLPAQTNQAVLQQNGVDVTAQIVVIP